MKKLFRSLIVFHEISWYRINRSNIMNFNCFVVNFSLNDIKCEYFMNLSIIIKIKSYVISVVKFFDFDNLILKFIVISFHDNFDEFWYCIFLYLTCVACMFFWQLWHFLMYVLTCCFMLKNKQCCCKNCNVLLTIK